MGFAHQFTHVEEVHFEMACDAAIARYPDDPIAYLTRADSEMQAGDRVAAIADYSADIRLDPHSYAGLYGRATAFYIGADYEDALKDLDLAVAANAGDGDAYMLRGLIDEARGDDDLADRRGNRGDHGIQGLSSRRLERPVRLGVAYSDLGYFKPAIGEFDAVLAKPSMDHSPYAARVYRARAFAWFSLGYALKAKSDFVATRVRSNDASASLDLAIFEYAQGDAASALADAQKALAVSSSGYAAVWVLVTSPGAASPAAAVRRLERLRRRRGMAGTRRARLPRQRADAVTRGRGSLGGIPRSGGTSCAKRASTRVPYTLADDHRAQALPLLRQAATECPYREIRACRGTTGLASSGRRFGENSAAVTRSPDPAVVRVS